MRATEWAARFAAPVCRAPGVEKALSSRFRSYASKLADRRDLEFDARQSFIDAAALDIPRLRDAVRGLAAIAEDFRITRAHRRLADALGASLEQWPDAAHAVHLTNPYQVLEVCRQVVADATAQGRDRRP